MGSGRNQPQLLNLPTPVVFLHIAKTAGTSIVHFFRKHLPAQSLCSHGDFLHFPSDRDTYLQQLRQYQFISGHFGFIDIEPLLRDAYSFTFLRDPIDRALSFYKFCLHEDMQRQFPVARAAASLGLEDFLCSSLPEVSEMLDNQQTWQLARMYWQEDRKALSHLSESQLLDLALENLAQFNHVGLTETFDTDFQRIRRDLGIELQPGKGHQLKTQQPVTRAEISPATLQTLTARQALDAELVKRVRAEHPTAADAS
jgi:hypothetical protein